VTILKVASDDMPVDSLLVNVNINVDPGGSAFSGSRSCGDDERPLNDEVGDMRATAAKFTSLASTDHTDEPDELADTATDPLNNNCWEGFNLPVIVELTVTIGVTGLTTSTLTFDCACRVKVASCNCRVSTDDVLPDVIGAVTVNTLVPDNFTAQLLLIDGKYVKQVHVKIRPVVTPCTS